MKNPNFLTNGTIIVLKPNDLDETNRIAVIVGRYEHVVEGQPEYVAIPVVLNPDDDNFIRTITSNESLYSFFSVFEDEIVSILNVVPEVEEKEWVFTHVINSIIDSNGEGKDRHIKKLENNLLDALEEKNFTKFKWIISNTQLYVNEAKKWIAKLGSNKEFYIEYFDVKEKDIDNCLSKLEKQLDE